MSVVLCVVAQQHDVVVGRCHGVYPLVVAHFQQFTYFIPFHLHHVEIVFVFVELEHVAHEDVSFFYFAVEGEWSVDGNVSPGHFQLYFMYEVVERRASEESIACGDSLRKSAKFGVDISCHVFLYFLHVVEVVVVEWQSFHFHELTLYMFASHFSVGGGDA